MSGEERTLSIVLPALNERDNLPAAVAAAFAAGADLGFRTEVIVVDDGSTDGTAEVLERLAAEHPSLRVVTHPENRGYGAALRSGFGAAGSDLVFYTDADNQFDLSELARFLPLIDDHDLVVGYRLERSDPRLRLFAAHVYNRIADAAFATGVRDVDCSFKLIRREALDRIEIETDDFFADTELIAKSRRLGFRICELGVRHYPRTAGETTVRLSHVFGTLHDIARMWRPIRGMGE